MTTSSNPSGCSYREMSSKEPVPHLVSSALECRVIICTRRHVSTGNVELAAVYPLSSDTENVRMLRQRHQLSLPELMDQHSSS